MDELGQILREARENKGLSLTEVQSEIRINAKYLEALEKGNYAALPTPVHVRGFLRNYARFLGLDPQPLLDRYQGTASARTNGPGSGEFNSAAPLMGRSDQPFFDPVNVEVNIGDRRSPESALRLIIIAALILALALIANRFIPLLLNNQDGTQAITEEITNALQDIVQNGEIQAEPTIDINATLTATDVITSTSRNPSGSSALPTPSPTRPLLPATLDTIDLKLEITERTWMEVTIDGDVVFSGIARSNDVYEWQAEQEAKVLTGNAIGIVVTINDITLGRLGGRGENKEELWRTTQ